MENYKFAYTETELTILDSFQKGIAKSIILEPDKFRVMNATKSCVAIYKFENPYEYEPAAIYELKDFLQLIHSFKWENHEIEDVCEEYFLIHNKEDKSKLKFFKTKPEMVEKVLDVNQKFSKIEPELKFLLTGEKLASIDRIGKVLRSDYIFFENNDGKVRATIANDLISSENNTYEIPLNEKVITNDLKDTLKMSLKELVLYPGNYMVEMSTMKISHWKSEFLDLEYYIGCAKN